jgi:hypothetical protein
VVSAKKVCISKYLSDNFLIQNGSEHAIMKVQENNMGLKLNGTHHLLAYADDVNLLAENMIL